MTQTDSVSRSGRLTADISPSNPAPVREFFTDWKTTYFEHIPADGA